MTDDAEIRAYLQSVRSSLQVPREQRDRALEEIESHLRDGSAEYRRGGATPAQAVAQVIERLGPPEALAAAFTAEGPPVPNSTGLVRWAPLLVPVMLLAVAAGLLGWSITWVFDGWSAGQRAAQQVYLRSGVAYGLLSYAAFLCIRRADGGDRAWRRAAWACTAFALAVSAIW